MAKTRTGSNAPFLGGSLSVVEIGEHLYGYSGAKAIASGSAADTTMLNFNTGKYYTLADISWHADATTTADEFVVVKLNGVIVMLSSYSHAYYSSGDQPYCFLIPPLTAVEVLFGSHSNTTATVTLTGKIYA